MGVLVLVDPVVGTTTDATLIAANDAAIKAVINGGIDASNFAAGKILNPNKITQAAAAVGQALVWNGTDWAPAAAGAKTYRKNTTKTVNTTTTPTDLLNSEITIAAGDMGTTGLLRATFGGDFLNNSGATVNAPRFQLLLGGTTLLDTGASVGGSGLGSSATRGAWGLVAEVENLGAANSQSVKVTLIYGGPTLSSIGWAPTTGNGGGWMETNVGNFVATNSTAVDTTLARALVLNVINGSASASYETKLLDTLVEVL